MYSESGLVLNDCVTVNGQEVEVGETGKNSVVMIEVLRETSLSSLPSLGEVSPTLAPPGLTRVNGTLLNSPFGENLTEPLVLPPEEYLKI